MQTKGIHISFENMEEQEIILIARKINELLKINLPGKQFKIKFANY